MCRIELRPSNKVRILRPLASSGGEKGPVILVAFKAIDPVLRGQGGGFDSHTLPPQCLRLNKEE